MTDMKTWVVAYLRVSTKKQANDPTSLPAQRQTVLDFCAKQGWQVAEIFVDAGETAYKVDKATDRPKFAELLRYCSEHRRQVSYVVFENTSRFSRKMLHSELAVEQIEKQGVRYWSVCDPGVNSDDPNGRYNLQGLVREAENFSRQLSRKMAVRSQAAFRSGRWARAALIGYVNSDRKAIGPNVVPDPKQAHLVQKAFQLLAEGFHTQEEVRQIVNSEGLRTHRGNPVSAQTFNKLTKNVFYCGWMVSEKNGERAKGLHQPLISEELFERAQHRGRPVAASQLKRKINPALPLKNFVRCEACGTKLTGGFAKSKTGALHGYYWCRNKECRAVKSVPIAVMEFEFKSQLQRLQPSEKTLQLFPRVASKLWNETQGDTETQCTKLNAQLTEVKRQKSGLLKMRLNGELSPEEFKENNAEYQQQIEEIEYELHTVQSASVKQEAFMRFLEVRLLDVAGAWEKASPESRTRVQTILFAEGLSYDPKSQSLNSAKSTLYKHLIGEERVMNQFGVPDGI